MGVDIVIHLAHLGLFVCLLAHNIAIERGQSSFDESSHGDLSSGEVDVVLLVD